MNEQQSNFPHLVLVRNRAGVSVPFSVESLATSVLVSGIEAPAAYRLADGISEALRAARTVEIESRALVESTAELLEGRFGLEAAERYRGWRELRQQGRPLVLCLLGAPGVGKSTVATHLAPRLGIDRVVPTEALREVLRTTIPESVLPELHISAHEASAHDGSASDGSDGQASPSQPAETPSPCVSGFLRQAGAVAGAAAAVAERTVREGRSLLLVGAHLVPGAMQKALRERGSNAYVLELLLTLDEQSLHRAMMLRRLRSSPSQPGVRHVQSFAAVRALQDELRELAQKAGVMWQDLANPEGLTEWIVDHAVAAHREGQPSVALLA
ncbi:MAG: hypothetical protein AB8H80_18590 [Planctomycetota bacterium]